MMASGVTEKYVYETADLLFHETKDGLIRTLYDEVEERGLRSLREEVEDGRVAREALRAEIEKRHLGQIVKTVKERIREADSTVQRGIPLLSQFLSESLARDTAAFVPRGFERTWSLLVGDRMSVDALVQLGIVYCNHYDTNAYSHPFPVVPDYALEILDGVSRDERELSLPRIGSQGHDLRKFLEQPAAQGFLTWLGGTSKQLTEHEEQEAIKEKLSTPEIQLDWEGFQEVREEFVRHGALIIDYYPHRRSVGSRSSKPASWSYELTEAVYEELAGIYLEGA